MEYCLPKLHQQRAGEAVLSTLVFSVFLVPRPSTPTSVRACSDLTSVPVQQQGHWCPPKVAHRKLWSVLCRADLSSDTQHS